MELYKLKLEKYIGTSPVDVLYTMYVGKNLNDVHSCVEKYFPGYIIIETTLIATDDIGIYSKPMFLIVDNN